MKLPDEIEAEIEAAIDQPLGCVSSEALGRARRIDDAAGRYIEFCKSTFPNELDLSGLSIVVDAANGAAYHIAPHGFRELGAEVFSIGCKPDGLNINEGVGSMHPEAMVAEVRARAADMGGARDGGAASVRLVDERGRLDNGEE